MKYFMKNHFLVILFSVAGSILSYVPQGHAQFTDYYTVIKNCIVDSEGNCLYATSRFGDFECLYNKKNGESVWTVDPTQVNLPNINDGNYEPGRIFQLNTYGHNSFPFQALGSSKFKSRRRFILSYLNNSDEPVTKQFNMDIQDPLFDPAQPYESTFIGDVYKSGLVGVLEQEVPDGQGGSEVQHFLAYYPALNTPGIRLPRDLIKGKGATLADYPLRMITDDHKSLILFENITREVEPNGDPEFFAYFTVYSLTHHERFRLRVNLDQSADILQNPTIYPEAALGPNKMMHYSNGDLLGFNFNRVQNNYPSPRMVFVDLKGILIDSYLGNLDEGDQIERTVIKKASRHLVFLSGHSNGPVYILDKTTTAGPRVCAEPVDTKWISECANISLYESGPMFNLKVSGLFGTYYGSSNAWFKLFYHQGNLGKFKVKYLVLNKS